MTPSEIALAEEADKSGPEPPGRPKMDEPTDARIFNKQIINNQFSNQLPNMLVTTVPAVPGSAFNIWENSQNLPMQRQQLFTFIPIAPFLNQIDATNLQQTYQQFVAQPLPYNLQNTNAAYNPPQYSQNWQPPHKMTKSARYQRNQYFKNQELLKQNLFSSDLRKKIVRSRSYSGSCVNNNQERESSTWTDNNKRNEETSIRMNLAPLKTLTTSGSDSNQWYIVVDADVILKNYNYLNDMATADPDCHLYVPHHVMSELREHASKSSNVQARRILRFLTQQIESGLAILGEEVTGEDISHKTILACVQLATQNNVVVILINETVNYQTNMKNIHVFTIQEIKDILENRSIRRTRAASPKMAIQIVVKNNGIEKIQYPESEICETPSQRNVDSTVCANINARTKSSIHTLDYSRNNQIPQTDVNLADSMVVTRNAVGVCSVNNAKTDYLRSPNRIVNNPNVLTDSGDRSRNPYENFKTDYQIPRKPVGNGNKELTDTRSRALDNSKTETRFSPRKPGLNLNRKLADTSIPKNALENSETDCQSLRKALVNNAKETTDPGCSNSNSADHPSPYKPVLTRKKKRTSPACAKSAPEDLNSETADRSSLRSSTSNVSLEQSMNRLVSKPQAQTITRQTSTETQRKPRSKSKSRCTSYTSSIDRLVKKNESRNVTIEETSVSAISNSENYNSEKVVSPVNVVARLVKKVASPVKKVALRNVVMFGVACKSMEDALKQRSDEWVFRFVQIMEEVLRVKLQEEIPFESKEPTPWNLQKAARCIIKKFSNHFNVVDAANKLSFVLYKTSDEQGKIAVNILPADYMEMYSYGLFLVETFKDMECVSCSEKDFATKRNKNKDEQDSCSCYEVKTAYDSLRQLLYDILNVNMETFVDHPRDISMENPIPDSDLLDSEMYTREDVLVPGAMEAQNCQQEERQCDDNTPKLCNLQSQINVSENTECEELPAKEPIKGDKIVILENLLLKNTHPDNSNVHKDNQDLTNTDKHNDLKNKVSCAIKPYNIEQIQTLEKPNDFAKPQAKIIHKFIINEELERKVRERQNEKEYEDCADESEKSDSNNSTTAAEIQNIETNKEINIEANLNFKRFVGSFVRKLEETFIKTQSICVEYVEEIRKNSKSNNTRVLKKKLEIACTFISKIHDRLESTSKREQDTNNNIQMLLKLAKIYDYVPDDELCLEYRHIIDKCMVTAGDVLKTVQNILKIARG